MERMYFIHLQGSKQIALSCMFTFIVACTAAITHASTEEYCNLIARVQNGVRTFFEEQYNLITFLKE